MELIELSYRIIGIAMRVHTQLGSGMMESVYETVMEGEMVREGLNVKRQLEVPITYENYHFDKAFRLDLLVEDQIVVEIKSVKAIGPEHIKQVSTYLKMMKLKLGLIFNFAEPSLRYGIKRVVNGL